MRAARFAVGRHSRRREGSGFKALKSVGWQWRKTRRTDPARVERRWPVLSAATLLTLATGSRAEDAQALNRVAGAAESGAGAQSHHERVSSWLVDAEPSSDEGRDAAARAAAARTVAAPAGGREGRPPPRNPKPAPVSPSWEKAMMTARRAQARAIRTFRVCLINAEQDGILPA